MAFRIRLQHTSHSHDATGEKVPAGMLHTAYPVPWLQNRPLNPSQHASQFFNTIQPAGFLMITFAVNSMVSRNVCDGMNQKMTGPLEEKVF